VALVALAGGLVAPGAVAAPSSPSLRLGLQRTFTVRGRPVTVPGRAVSLRAIVRPWVPGQWATVEVSLNGRALSHRQVAISPSPDGTYGVVADSLASPRAGPVTVAVSHTATAELGSLAATAGFTALGEIAHFGSTGPFVALVQQRLAALHFFIAQTGVYDQGTRWAIDAYHRLLRWGTAQTLDTGTITALLDGRGAFAIRYPGDGKHVEGNLARQLLALISSRGRVLSIYPISSGKPSTPTVLGRFRVYLKRPGYLPDGMYYSSFFYRGYAIHGYDPAPDYPASHGCMRVPIPDAISIYNWLRIGDWVDVYP
jgi:hypothetical protein